ncbi:hypothetical protein M427DRAFT_214955 [Gonapodya prolifera JEL478]|uniref:F-box domain-containing protein n=1 Tax=Gonapodya prolifera (strain JEL478) TaxID=1344416 RepID=A0A138ZYY2_GONPJ|nr:hypothetical protein M427DRAFT_214955 [Gonapodya prolifera JEL478]|eukprot:KXS09722.1 hypothetical protein M427DRAFT_214955 [Gonapodya prolifera JEL478]
MLSRYSIVYTARAMVESIKATPRSEATWLCWIQPERFINPRLVSPPNRMPSSAMEIPVTNLVGAGAERMDGIPPSEGGDVPWPLVIDHKSPSSRQESWILPTEVLLGILTHVDVASLYRLRRASRGWKSLAERAAFLGMQTRGDFATLHFEEIESIPPPQ